MRLLRLLHVVLTLTALAAAGLSLYALNRVRASAFEREIARDREAYQLRESLDVHRRNLQEAHAHVLHRLRADEFPWTPSPDGKLAVRLVPDADEYGRGQPTVVVLAEVKNTGTEPIRVPVPQAMPYPGDSKLRGPAGEVRYQGPVPSQAPPTIVELAPGRVARQSYRFELAAYAGADQPGRYRLSLLYRPAPSNPSAQSVEVACAWTRN